MGLVTFTITLFVAVVAGWAHRTMFDSHQFAVRATTVLDSAEVRKELADQITDQLIVTGDPTLASYRSLLVGIVEDLVDTSEFREAFREAVEETHRTVMLRHADKALLQLGASLTDLTGSAEDADTGLAKSLPADVSSVLVDVTPIVDRIDPYRVGRHVADVARASAVLALLSAAAVLVAAQRRRRAVMALGLAAVVAAVCVLGLTAAIPNLAADRVASVGLAAPVRDAATRFIADLSSLALGMMALGVLVAAAATAATPPHVITDVRRHLARAVAAATGDLGRAPQAGVGLTLVLGGALVFFDSAAVVTMAAAAVGALLGYVGLISVFLAVLGEEAAVPADADRRDRAGIAWSPRLIVCCVIAGVLAIVATIGSLAAVVRTGDTFQAAAVMRCNGSANLCDRRLDQVVFAGSHNSMSSSSDPGWVFAEQLTGIRAQLQSGVRALLVKTHYGIRTGVQVNGAELVVTDEADETAVNQAEETAEIGPEAVARATQLRATTPATASARDIYLCHVYCELGATKFSVALHDIRRFMDSHPDDVIMLFAGDYVSAAETASAFDAAGLTDRTWTYDTSQPPPTLREMIKARRTLLVLSEHSGPPPPWYTKGYGIFQDTPFTFAAPSDFTCTPNRGPADAPLFEINHFITNARPPSFNEAQQVNSEASLTARIQQCQNERGLRPTILAVDFASVGDLMGVVDRMNGVDRGS